MIGVGVDDIVALDLCDVHVVVRTDIFLPLDGTISAISSSCVGTESEKGGKEGKEDVHCG